MIPFAELESVTQLMRGFTHPWYIAGGWAIDLFLGRITRTHSDVDIAILRRDQYVLRSYLAQWAFQKVTPCPTGSVFETWNEGEWLELPIHEIHAQCVNNSSLHLEFLLNEASDHDWQFRKNLQMTRPLHVIGLHSETDIPFLCPEVVLLYKATTKTPVPANDADFNNVYAALGREQREWLRQGIEGHDPQHTWLGRLV